MIYLERNRIIQASVEDVWAVLGRYMHIDEFAPFIASVDALTTGEDGLGSKRRNHFENGGSLVEEVIEWNEGQGFTVRLSEMENMPVDDASSEVRILPDSDGTRIIWSFTYRMKYGPVGWLIGQTLMRLMMNKGIDGNLQGLSEKVVSARN